MSKEINNSQYRQQVIRNLLSDLHQGKSAEDVKSKFQEAFEGVSAQEISQAEQALIEGGMAVEEVQRLCDVHAAVFKDSLNHAVKPSNASFDTAGHPAHTLTAENRAIETALKEAEQALATWQKKDSALPDLVRTLERLQEIDKHFLRKENLLFPYMEKHGITAPPKVMWGVDDEIRSMLKQAISLAKSPAPDKTALSQAVEETAHKIREMIFKEESIMLPMLADCMTESEWQLVAEESHEIGFCLISAPKRWHTKRADQAADAEGIVLPSGQLSLSQLICLLDGLPIDITFVDDKDTVKYFSQGMERIFPRTKTILGRKVSNCHPPASVHIVENLLADFKKGKKTEESFWIKMGGKYIYIRYFALHDKDGKYLGTLEVTQNIAPLQKISGEKRLVD